MRDVGERPGVHQAGLALERLDQVRLQSFLEQHGHGARGAEVLGGDGLAAVEGIGDRDRAEAPAEVVQVTGHGEDRHHLGSRCDVERGFARVAVGPPAEPEHDLAQRPVVHVHGTPPADPQGVDLVRVAVQDRGVEQRGEQVVGCTDGMDVAGEVEVQVLHRDDLREPATGGATLDAEHGAKRRLTQTQHGRLADRAEALGEADRGGGLALAGFGRSDPGHAHELAVGDARHPVDHGQRHLGLVAPVGLHLVGLEPGALGDLIDQLKLRFLRNLETALHVFSLVDGRAPRGERSLDK